MNCPLCGTPARAIDPAHHRRWFDCDACGLVFVHPADRPDAATEAAHYTTHENDPGDPGYRGFLDRLAAPLARLLDPGAEGLDYGSGPGPTLSVMLSERGFPTAAWDPFFAPDPAPLTRTWDFVTCSETVEHFHQPARAYARLSERVRPGGLLAIMTEPVPGDVDLGGWRYARDPTHVSLHRPRTFEWLADRWGWELDRPSRTVWIYRRPR